MLGKEGQCSARTIANIAQLHSSYSSLGRDFKSIFDNLTTQIIQQHDESNRLWRQLQSATRAIAEQSIEITNRTRDAMEEERRQAAEYRQNLLLQITTLVNSQAEKQEVCLAERTAQLHSIFDLNASLQDYIAQHGDGMDVWNEKQKGLLDQVAKSGDTMKTKLKDGWNVSRDTASRADAQANYPCSRLPMTTARLFGR